MRRLAVAAATGVAALLAASGSSGADRAGAAPCLGQTSASQVVPRPAPRLRFGINPAGVAGALGPPVAPAPDRPREDLAALARLRPPGRPFILRLNRFFWSDGAAGVHRFHRLVHRYTSRDYEVELQLRYHPRPDQ